MRYLGVDWGLKSLGLAISEGELATPYQQFSIFNFQFTINKIREIVNTEKIDQLVVGVPESGEAKVLAIKAIKRLRDQGLQVVAADETLSSSYATKLMVKSGTSKKKRLNNHAFAAALILQGYLDER